MKLSQNNTIEVILLTKFQDDSSKIIDFLLVVNFWLGISGFFSILGRQLPPSPSTQFFENFTYFSKKLPQNRQKSIHFKYYAPPVLALPFSF